MQNEGTTDTLLTNKTTTGVALSFAETNDTLVTNAVTVPETIDNVEIDATRYDGLWVYLIQPWDLEEPWTFEAILKSNTILTNV
jgi:hypothetical protein